MAISKDKKDHIITHYTDHTIRELASMHSVSTSTVQRVIAQAKSMQESMKNDANVTTSNTNTDTDTKVVPGDTDNTPASNDHFQYTPDLPEDQKEVLLLDEDAGMGKLLQGLKDDDPFQSLVDEQQQESNTAASEALPAATNTPPATATLPAADDMADQEGLDAMIESLLGEPAATSGGSKISSKRKKNTGASTKTNNSNGAQFVSSNNNNTMIKASPYSTGISADIPTPIIRTQCQLYAEHFKSLLEPVIGRTDTEQRTFVKGLIKMDRRELEATLVSLKSSVCIQNGCAMVKNAVIMGCGVIEQVAPIGGMDCTSLTQRMSSHDDEIRNCALEYCIDNFDWIRQKSSPEMRLFTLVTSTALQVDSQNRTQAAYKANQQVNLDMQQKYQNM